MNTPLYLGVNVDHVATLRQARRVAYPSPLEAALMAAEAGAHGITVHLREDRRHIQDQDVEDMRHKQPLPLNLEMAHTSEMVSLALKIKPDEVCLVPEKRQELTTEGGLDISRLASELEPSVHLLLKSGIQVSPFVDPDIEQIDACVRLGVPMIELHTGTYCDNPNQDTLAPLTQAATYAHQKGLQVNAGHGITLDTLPGIRSIPHLHTLNIGHSIVARAVLVGMKAAVTEMLAAMQNPHNSSENET